MQKIAILNIIKEIMWWLATFLTCYIVLKPIIDFIDYKHVYFNCAMIVTSIQFFRYTIFFRQNLFLQNKWMRFLFFLISIQLIIYYMRTTHLLLVQAETLDLSEFGKFKFKPTMTQTYQITMYIKEELKMATIAACLTSASLVARIIYSMFGLRSSNMKNLLSSQSTRTY